MKYRLYLLALILALPAAVSAGSKETEGKKVDSGSFGVFMAGRRMGTETFSITQNANGSVIQSEFKTEGVANQAAQSSEMQLTATGEIRRYDWKELSPGKAQAGILPNDQFLMQKWSANPDETDVVREIQDREPLLLDAVYECAGDVAAALPGRLRHGRVHAPQHG